MGCSFCLRQVRRFRWLFLNCFSLGCLDIAALLYKKGVLAPAVVVRFVRTECFFFLLVRLRALVYLYCMCGQQSFIPFVVASRATRSISEWSSFVASWNAGNATFFLNTKTLYNYVLCIAAMVIKRVLKWNKKRRSDTTYLNDRIKTCVLFKTILKTLNNISQFKTQSFT